MKPYFRLVRSLLWRHYSKQLESNRNRSHVVSRADYYNIQNTATISLLPWLTLPSRTLR